MTTALQVTATPGKPQTFAPKSAGGGGPKPEDQVTTLSVIAIPGGLRTFIAKAAVIEEPSIKVGGGGPRFEDGRLRQQLLREDEELLLIATLIAKGLH